MVTEQSTNRLTEIALFAGAGGGILAGKLLGWRTICAVECNAYAASVLIARQNDGILEPFPVWDDVTTFDGTRWRGRVDIVSGGFPCQDISVANPDGEGIEGASSGLWKEFERTIRDVEPRFVFVENSPALTFRGLGVVLADLAKLGYNARWGVLGASDVGGDHIRKRIWIFADTNRHGLEGRLHEEFEALPGFIPQKLFTRSFFNGTPFGIVPQPIIIRKLNEVASGMDRLKAIGNGQVPAVAASAWRMLSNLK